MWYKQYTQSRKHIDNSKRMKTQKADFLGDLMRFLPSFFRDV